MVTVTHSRTGGTGSTLAADRPLQTREHVVTLKIEIDTLLTPAEVTTIFDLDAKTITRWAKNGRITTVRTLGGHRRYREAEVQAILTSLPRPRTPDV
jgi:excisionase family DNA binding protein